jgi:hypothetical protein
MDLRTNYKPLMGSSCEIILEKNFQGRQPDFNDFDAVLNCVSRLNNVSKLVYKDYDYMINTMEPVEVADGIMFELLDVKSQDKSGSIEKIVYRLYSEDLPIKDLKEYVQKCRHEYEAIKNNKLGEETCFFDQSIANDMRFQNALSFDRKKFTTFRTFDNVFFEEKKEVEGRVQHFLTNKQWYVKRGIPYTLGFMFFGGPGCGKTSTIKAIANITKRHVVNVKLSEIKTNTQLKNLFYNPVLQVINPETLLVEKFVVPIHQRLYVIEDIDCMTDVIKRRDLQEAGDAKQHARDDNINKGIKHVQKQISQKKGKKEQFKSGDEELDEYFQTAMLDEKIEMLKEKMEEEQKDRITLDSLLNILDGTLEIPNRMFCITTNHLDIIDPALVRPGRVDMIIEFKNTNRAIMKQMFESFYEKEFEAAKFAKIKEYKISPAQINQVLFKHFNNSEEAIAELIVLGNKHRRKTTPSVEGDDTPPMSKNDEKKPTAETN